jgi:hypothetical protein
MSIPHKRMFGEWHIRYNWNFRGWVWVFKNGCSSCCAMKRYTKTQQRRWNRKSVCVTEAIRRSRNSDHLHNVANFSKERFTTTWASYRRFLCSSGRRIYWTQSQCCATNLRTENNNSVRGTGSTLILGTAKTTLEIQTAIRMLSGSQSSTDTAAMLFDEPLNPEIAMATMKP